MTAVADNTVPGTRPGTVAPASPSLGSRLFELVAELGTRLVNGSDSELVDQGCPEAELIDRIARLETLHHQIEAARSATIHTFARRHAATRTASGVVEPEKLERSIGAQVALACRVSPTEGRRRVRVGRDLRAGHDHVQTLFTTGELSFYKTSTITTATADLDPAERAQVDSRLAGHDLARMGVGRIRDLARTLAAEVAPETFTKRCRDARNGRRVSLRPAAEGMTYLSAYLPVEQGVACYAALAKAVNDVAVSPEPVTRGRGQIMADTLVERVTGQATATDVHIEVQVVVPLQALVDPDSPLPARIPGHGPAPLDLLATSGGRKTWRRLVTRDGIVIGGDSRQRVFTGHLAELIRARDGHRCSEPYCDAPIRHLDHLHRAAEHGPTRFDNGRGVCEFHNYLRETPGWRVQNTPAGVRTTTPTGHSYLQPPWRATDAPTGPGRRGPLAVQADRQRRVLDMLRCSRKTLIPV